MVLCQGVVRWSGCRQATGTMCASTGLVLLVTNQVVGKSASKIDFEILCNKGRALFSIPL